MPDDNSTRFFLVNPVATGFFITDPFNSPRPYANGRHEGIDLRAVAGGKAVSVLAAQRGVVERVKQGDTGYGNYVRLRHDWPDGTTWVTWYAHLSAINPAIQAGETVEIGQRLGVAGTTGNSTAVHLHLTLQHLGGLGLSGYVVPDVVDPTRYFSNVTTPTIDEMTYVADVTIPDGSLVEAGRPFTKTWRVRNTGTSTWGEGFVLAFFSGDEMGGPESVALPALKPDEVGEVSISLVAPTGPGRHRTTWKARNARNRAFAFELYADIVVTPVARRDAAVYVADVTVPDGSAVEAGQVFLKTWRVRNTGDTTWDGAYRLGFTGEEQLGAPDLVSIPTTRPGATADITIPLMAPAEPGRYRSTWQLRNAAAKPFGAELFADFRVDPAPARTNGATHVADVTVPDGARLQPGASFVKTWRVRNSGSAAWGDGYALAFIGENPMGGPASVPLPALEPGDEGDVSVTLIAPAQAGRHRTSWQARSPQGEPFGDILYAEIEVVRLGTLDDAVYESDVTYPDGTVVNAGDRMVKTWRIRNTGNSAWTTGYALVFAADNKMNGPDSVPLPAALPGESVEVSVALLAPMGPGIHRSTWRPRNPDGQLFGELFYTEIRVPVSSTPGASNIEDAQLDAHVTVPDGTEVEADKRFTKTWALRNTGSTPWSSRYELAFVGGTEMGEAKAVAVASGTQTVPPQGVVPISVELQAPAAAGRYIGRWRMRNPRGEFFGSTLFVSVVVVERPTKFDMLEYLRGDGRLYEMKHIFEMPNGPLIGQQRVQTQHDGKIFYTVKNSEWEELWADDRYIYRGSDTSPGSGNFYTLMDGEHYGSAWMPRQMAVGQTYRRSVTVVSRRKGNCMMNSHLSGRHATWIKLEAIHSRFVVPDVEGRPGRGIALSDVAVLAAFSEVSGRPAARPFERYYYAKQFGLVMWEGIETDHKGASFIVQIHKPGDRPDNVRERIPCLEALRPRP